LLQFEAQDLQHRADGAARMPEYLNSLTRREALRLLGLRTAELAACLPLCGPPVCETDAQSLPTANEDVSLGSELATAGNIADSVRSRKVSAVEVVEKHLKRIEAANPSLNAFVFVDPAAALKSAQSIDMRIRRGEDPGPLAGVPFAIKDLDDCAGMPTSRGSMLYKGQPPVSIDSPHVARARAAGAVMIGKTATPEFGWLSITASKAWGITRNPWDTTKTPGGSSGGSSAAIASGMAPLATGSDSGGSIRSPAAFTGLVGLKPSFGRIGQMAVGDRQVSGCLSLDVRDTARFLDVAARPAPFDRTSLPPTSQSYEKLMDTLHVSGLRAVWSSDLGYIPTEHECIDVARRAAEALVRAAKLVLLDRPVSFANNWRVSIRPTTGVRLGELELDGLWPAKEDQLTEEVRDAFSKAGSFTSIDLASAERAKRELFVQVAELFEEVDVLLTPATTVVSLPAEGPVPVVIAGREAQTTGAEAHLRLANLAGLPAISVPAGLSSTGFPIGLQIICPRWRDDMVLRLAHILEVAQPWPHRAPPYR
jgi:aspartyl-tRNA(Asn)/glutamyl-tRNA(Gln) amidotransferase subunit A